MTRNLFFRFAFLALLLGAAPLAQAKWLRPDLPDPGDFVTTIDNPLFPLEPGTTFYYEGESDGEAMSDVMYVTHDTIQILGITCTVVSDQVFDADGNLAEDTLDYYAQDSDGNVWYMGEDTEELDADGNVISTEGTWRAGVDGAEAGLIMPAHPKKGDHYRQEYLEGEAEDMAKVQDEDGSASVPYGAFDHLLVTKEWSPLELGVTELKYYAEDVGFVYSIVTKGGDEELWLVDVTHE